MRGVRLRLEEYRKNASSAERDIVDYILSDPEAAVGQSIHKLAAQTYTSASTVVRLCKKLGCGGYKEFQQALIYELAVSNKSNDIAVGGVIAGDTTDVIIEKVTAKNISSLELTRQLLDAQVVDLVVSLMMQAHSICLFGMGASLLVARDLQLKLMRLNINCNLSDDYHSQMLYAKNMGREDLAIVVSWTFPRRFRSTFQTSRTRRAIRSWARTNLPFVRFLSTRLDSHQILSTTTATTTQRSLTIHSQTQTRSYTLRIATRFCRRLSRPLCNTSQVLRLPIPT